MAVDQLPGRVREFAGYLNRLMTKLDQGVGWCAVFWQRDPDGMRACLDGTEVPPWDVVEALMHDLATAYGPAAAAQETERARALHRASLAAFDAQPGGRDALGDRLDVMLREQRYAAERTAELTRRLGAAATQEEADSLRLDLAWAHDDHERATARCTELRARMEEYDRRVSPTTAPEAPRFPGGMAGDVFRVPDRQRRSPRSGPHDDTAHGGRGTGPEGTTDPGAAARTEPFPDTDAARAASGAASAADPAAAPATDPESQGPADELTAPASTKQRPKRRFRGGARFAGVADGEGEAPAAAVPETAPAPAPARKGRSPRGARFAGVAAQPEQVAPQQEKAVRVPMEDEARREVVGTVDGLVRLRKEGRSGEAHALLVEVAHWPAERFPLLAAELHRAGLGADWATLLWEVGSLPIDRLVTVVDALNVVGRTADGDQIVKQGVARPAEEIGEAVAGLVAEGRDRQARALLDAYVSVRTPEEAARVAETHPKPLTRMILDSARGISSDRHRDVKHALRVAGLA
ncbi:hypothetical protein ACWD4G_26625 [Streptomyces sp. NPDC002643]